MLYFRWLFLTWFSRWVGYVLSGFYLEDMRDQLGYVDEYKPVIVTHTERFDRPIVLGHYVE